MKILFYTYASAFQNIGGGEIQLLKTREYLQKSGLKVDLFNLETTKVKEYDVVHIFSSVKECLSLAKTAREQGAKVVVSPVIWTGFKRALREEGSLKSRAMLLGRQALKAVLPSFPSARRKLLVLADSLYPNSEMEKRHIERYFAIPPDKMEVVFNGVDRSFASAEAKLFRRRYGAEPFILSVGRIEPRKNQLNLIRAAHEKSLRLVLIGSPVSGTEDYYQKCRKAGPNVQFIPGLDHKDPMLASAYAACDLLVLPAWFETPGLVALEGALAGARILVTQDGSAQEYFGDLADYLDPASPKDMALKIEKALARPKTIQLKERVLEHYTWEAVAERYIDCYKRLLERT